MRIRNARQKPNDMDTLEKLKAQYKNAQRRYNLALSKKYYTYSDQQKVYAQREKWSDRMYKLENEILLLNK